MTLQDFVNKHGTIGLINLAAKVGKNPDYFHNLLYSVNNNPEKPRLPSPRTAKMMVDASGGELTLDGLFDPKPMESSEDRPRMKRGWRKEAA